MTKIDLSRMVPEQINFDLTDLRNRLIPVMHQVSVSTNPRELKVWATTKIDELRQRLSSILPLEEHELLFIKKIRCEGIIAPDLITNDQEIAQKIVTHPAINWVIKQQ